MGTLRTALALIRLRFDRHRVLRAARNAASPEEAHADVRAFVAELAEAGLLEPDEAGRTTAPEESR